MKLRRGAILSGLQVRRDVKRDLEAEPEGEYVSQSNQLCNATEEPVKPLDRLELKYSTECGGNANNESLPSLDFL